MQLSEVTCQSTIRVDGLIFQCSYLKCTGHHRAGWLQWSGDWPRVEGLNAATIRTLAIDKDSADYAASEDDNG